MFSLCLNGLAALGCHKGLFDGASPIGPSALPPPPAAGPPGGGGRPLSRRVPTGASGRLRAPPPKAEGPKARGTRRAPIGAADNESFMTLYEEPT